MASLDWSQCPAVESIPGKVSGAWVFRGTRLPVATVIENLEDLSIEEVIAQFDVTREQIAAVLDFVAQGHARCRRVGHQRVHARHRRAMGERSARAVPTRRIGPRGHGAAQPRLRLCPPYIIRNRTRC